MPPPPDPGTPISRYREKKQADPSLTGILAVGDSWFAYPTWLETNIIDELIDENEGNAAWLISAEDGDEARQMLSGPKYEYLVQVCAEERLQFDAILFSGGGDDIVGRCLLTLLNQYKDGMSWMDCINLPRFTMRMGEVESAYNELAALRDDFQPGAYIFTHGYDYAIPNGAPVRVLWFQIGPWIKNYMVEKKGIVDPAYHKNIIDYMLTYFHDMQLRLEQTHERWVYIRTQGTLHDSDWANELHPTTNGFKMIAEKFQAALSGVFPNLPKPSAEAAVSPAGV